MDNELLPATLNSEWVLLLTNIDLKCKLKSLFRNQLEKLRKLGSLDIESDNKNSLITIVNWAQYQDAKQKDDSKKDNKRTTKGHRQ